MGLGRKIQRNFYFFPVEFQSACQDKKINKLNYGVFNSCFLKLFVNNVAVHGS